MSYMYTNVNNEAINVSNPPFSFTAYASNMSSVGKIKICTRYELKKAKQVPPIWKALRSCS